jgi:hypothetical protein
LQGRANGNPKLDVTDFNAGRVSSGMLDGRPSDSHDGLFLKPSFDGNASAHGRR